MKAVLNKELHRIVSTCIIRRHGKYLILRRALFEKAFPGRWTVPGGGLHPEDYLTAKKTTSDAWYFVLDKSLRREIKEETGLEVGELEYLLDLAFVRPDGIPVVTLSYFAPCKSGKVKLDDKHVEFAWVSAKEVYDYDLIEGIREEIEMVERILKGGRRPGKDKIKLFQKLLRKQ